MNTPPFFNIRHTTDDRGQSINAWALDEIHKQAGRSPELAKIRERAMGVFASAFTIWHALLIAVVAVGVLFVSAKLMGEKSLVWTSAVLIACFAASGWVWVCTTWRNAAPKLTKIFVEEGICAACAYSLEHLKEADDGMLVCPECSAAWRSDRIVRFAPVAKIGKPRTIRGELTSALKFMSQNATRRATVDDRDSPRIVVAIRSLPKVRSTDDHRARLARAARCLRPIGRFKRMVATALIGFTSLILMNGFVENFRAGRPVDLSSTLVGILGVGQFVFAFSVLFSDFGRSSRQVQRELIKNKLCPCCAADLQSLPQDHDRCTICPECGGAWKLGDPD